MTKSPIQRPYCTYTGSSSPRSSRRASFCSGLANPAMASTGSPGSMAVSNATNSVTKNSTTARWKRRRSSSGNGDPYRYCSTHMYATGCPAARPGKPSADVGPSPGTPCTSAAMATVHGVYHSQMLWTSSAKRRLRSS